MEDGDGRPRRFGVLELLAVVGVIGSLMVAYGRITDRIALMEDDIADLKKNELVVARIERMRHDIDLLIEKVDHINERELQGEPK